MNSLKNTLIPLLGFALSSVFAFTADVRANDDFTPSEHFDAVDAHLHRGGIFYGYVDVEGDLHRFATDLAVMLDKIRQIFPQLMIPPVPVTDIIEATGFGDIGAVGASSIERGNLFHNRTFFSMPDGPQGLMLLAGTENRPFASHSLAPAGADILHERTVDGEPLLAFIRELAGYAAAIMGPEIPAMVEQHLTTPLPEINATPQELLQNLSGRMTFILDLDEENPMTFPELGELPGIRLHLQLENAAPLFGNIVEMLRLQIPGIVVSQENDQTIARIPFDGSPEIRPILVARQNRILQFASSESFLDPISASDTAITDDPLFRKAIRDLPEAGTAFTYVSPQVSAMYAEIVHRAMQETPDEIAEPLTNWILKSVSFDEPLASATSVEPNGLLIASNWHYSHKTNLTSLASLNPFTLGMISAMVIPTVGKVREQARETVIVNNLRQLSAAADQYFLETGETEVNVSDLIGPQSYISKLSPITGETYPDQITKDQENLIATLPDGREIDFPRSGW